MTLMRQALPVASRGSQWSLTLPACASCPPRAEAQGLGQPVKRTLPGGRESANIYQASAVVWGGGSGGLLVCPPNSSWAASLPLLRPSVRPSDSRRAEPHRHARPSLLQLSLPEGQYRAALPELQARLAAAGARGVYEERLPPELNAALQVRTPACKGACLQVVLCALLQLQLGELWAAAQRRMQLPSALTRSHCPPTHLPAGLRGHGGARRPRPQLGRWLRAWRAEHAARGPGGCCPWSLI